jgi:membrane protease YdiL (CAAX protease family)
MTVNELRKYWSNYFLFDWRFGTFLIALACIPRFLLVLLINKTGNYGPLGLVMILFAAVPFVFLNTYGRRQIGLTKANKWAKVILALLLGMVGSLILFYLGIELYGDTTRNWYQYIARSYAIPKVLSANEKFTLFAIMAGTGMIFSPIGEELFFRGIVQASFAKSLGEEKAIIVDSMAFALTHIAHFGLVFVDGRWIFYGIPTLIWVAGMFAASLLFHAMKRYTQSILGAIVCHAGFNLGMVYSIFYLL